MTDEPESLSELLMEAIEDGYKFMEGKIQLRTTIVEIPNREFKSKEIARIRKNLGMRVDRFAETMNVKPTTVRRWEKGIQKPKGPAVRLLQFLDSNPELILNSTTPKRTVIQHSG